MKTLQIFDLCKPVFTYTTPPLRIRPPDVSPDSKDEQTNFQLDDLFWKLEFPNVLIVEYCYDENAADVRFM